MQDDFLFEKIKDSFLKFDPVAFCEKYLTLDGDKFKIHGNGYKPFADIYRTIGIKCLEPDSKPVVLLKSRQTGGTTMASALEMYFMGCGLFGNEKNPPIRVIHAFPYNDHAESYSKVKLNSMINTSTLIGDEKDVRQRKPYMQTLIDKSSDSNQSLKFKQFLGGNHIFIDSVGSDGARMRGKTVDVIFFDEVQKMTGSGISNTTKTLNQSKYGKKGEGVQVYFGTPLQKNSTFFDIWCNSSQQYYFLGCEKCKKHFPLYTPGSNEWETIWLYEFIVRCTHCGFEQDKRDAVERGKWVALKEPNDCKFIGFHINQLYMPIFTKEQIIEQKPENNPTNSERSYQNEVLGEFYSSESVSITIDQIRDICGDPGRKFRQHITQDDGILTFLGIDIGEKNDLEQMVDNSRVKQQGQSYSAAVVIGLTGPTRISIEYAAKFKRNDLASKKGIIDELMRRYNCNLGVIDLGYTRDLSEILQTEYGDRMLCSQSSNRVNDKIKFNDSVFPKVISFEKDFWIADIYERMRKGDIRFPMGSYDNIMWLIEHCTNLEIKPSISRGGDIMPHYVKSGNTDGFAALLNAYIAYKFYISNGFKIKHPTLMKNTQKWEPPLAQLAYLPKIK